MFQVVNMHNCRSRVCQINELTFTKAPEGTFHTSSGQFEFYIKL